MTDGQFKPKVIIRTAIGSKRPLNGGVQHTQDYTKIFKTTLKEVKVIFLKEPKMIFPSFKKAYHDKKNFSYLFVENGDFYNEK
jgi:pyruvate/2-oxoglutarate/acetoin dehydrogenase E1 component